MKTTGGRLRRQEKAEGKSLGLDKKENGEVHTSFPLVGAG